MSAKISLQDLAVVRPVKDGSPRFQFSYTIRRFLCMQLGHSPVVYVLAAAHRVGKMDLPIVAVVDVRKGRRHAALGHYGMRFSEQRFAYQANRHTRRRSL